jgi:hypothetical protein
VVQAGVAQVCISPPIGVELAGYGPFLRRRSRSVHDDLYAAALVIEDGEMRVAIVTADIISFDVATVEHIRHLAAATTGIPPNHVLVSCIHSHTAPTARALRNWGERDLEYIALLSRHIAGAIEAANYARQPARIGWGLGDHPDLAWNREQRNSRSGASVGPVDTSVQVLRVDAASSGETIALLVNYACHPVMLGTHTAISADYPGALRRQLVAAFEGAVVLFANGTCGDIDPASNREVWGKATFADVDWAGAGLAAEAIRVARGVELRAELALAVERAWVDLPYQVLTAEQVAQEVERRHADLVTPLSDSTVRRRHFWQGWAQATQDALAAGAAPAWERAELQVIQVGDVVFLALPGEIFTEIGLAIKAASAYDQTFIVTFANGNVGYIATEEDYEQHGYASSMAFAIHGYFQFQPDVGSRLTAAVTALLKARLR